MGTEQQVTFDFVGSLADRVAETSQQPPRMSIVKNVSYGRELGVPRKCAAVTGASSFSARPAGALVRSTVSGRRSTAYLGDPSAGIRDIEALGGSAVVSGLVSGSRAMNAYWPTEITDAGVAFPQNGHAAVCDDIVATIVVVNPLTGPWNLYVSYLGGPPQLVGNLTFARTSVAITKHGAGVYRLWYMRSNAIRCRALSISGSTLTVGGENTIYTPVTAQVVQPAYASFGTDGNGDATFCWVLTQDAATNTTMRLLKVNIGTFAVTSSLAFAAELPSTNDFQFALAHLSIGGVNYLALAWSDASAAQARSAVVNGDSMTTAIAAAATGAGVPGPVAIQWMAVGTWVGTVVAACDNVATIGTSAAFTDFYFRQGPTMGSPGTTDDIVTMYWHQPLSAGCMWARSSTEVYPLFTMQANYDEYPALTDLEFLEDPSLEVYTPQLYDESNAEFTLSSVARFGVDRCVAGAAFGLVVKGAQAQYSFCTQAGVLRCIYNAEPGATYEGECVRFVNIDLTAGGRNVQDDKGVGLIGAAQPAYWDGNESVEWGPLHKPKVIASATGGTSTLLTGAYAYRAYVSWRDSAGQEHRSGVSLPSTTINPAGTAARIWVTIPKTCRDGVTQLEFEVHVYGSKNGGPFYLLQPSTTGRLIPTDKDDVGCWLFEGVPEVSATTLLWSTGAGLQELFPVAPPPLWDLAMVGPRLWAIDAENRSRAVCTKLKQDGIAHEFADGLEVLFTGGQKLYAVNELDGVPLFLTNQGAFLVHGDGFDNTGQGTGWSFPMRIAQPACTQRDSVVRTPVGVFYANDDRFVLLQSGGGARVFDELQAPTGIMRADVFEATTEVVFWTATGAAYVYNYLLDKWSTWDSSVDATDGIYVHGNQLIAFFSSGICSFRVVDVESPNTTLQARWKTGWVAIAGPQAPCTHRELLLLVKRQGTHGITVNVYTDYQTDAAHTTTVVLSNANVTSANEGGYYTERIVLNAPQARAFMVDVQETGSAGDGCVPIACTVIANVEPGVQRRYLAVANK
jgi:hypothetical protein